MRPLHEEFEAFGFEDSSAIRRIIREQRREERRMASRRQAGHDDDDWDDLDDGYPDYNEEEFDKFSGVTADQ